MELCTSSTAQQQLVPPFRYFPPLRKPSFYKLSFSHTRKFSGSLYCTNASLEPTTSEDSSGGPSQYVKDDANGVVVTEDKVELVENSGFRETVTVNEETPTDDEAEQFDLLNKLNIELDSNDSYSIVLLAGGGLAALWLASAIVGAIDSIPVFPKLMEVVGLGYTVWFSTRYLLFKKNRDELAAKVEEIKKQVLGSKDD